MKNRLLACVIGAMLLILLPAAQAMGKEDMEVARILLQIAALPDTSRISLMDETLTLKQMAQIKTAYSDTAFEWQLAIDGQTVLWSDTYLNLGSQKVRDLDTFETFLTCFAELTKVDMFETPIRPAAALKLQAAFPDIAFGWTFKIDTHLVRTDATAFSTLHGDRSRYHSSRDFEVLKFCRSLQALDLGHNNIDDLSFLQGLTELKILILAKNRVTDITPLQNLEKLEYLELFMNRITDISPLEGLVNLKDLEISRNKIDDFTPLEGLASLERLWLSGNGKNLPRESLAKALPGCYIDFESNPTQGGWREHPRYEDIKAIFKSGVYHEWTENTPGPRQ